MQQPDRGDGTSPEMGPNNTLNRSAQQLRCWVPAPLRIAAPGERERWASLDANQERRIYEVDHQVRWREVFLLVSCVVRSNSIEGGGRK